MPIKTVTVNQIQRLDRIAIGQHRIPSLVLMENAGRAVAREIMKRIARRKNPKIYVFCGLGNNAGDGFVAARHLIAAGFSPNVCLVGQGSTLKNDAAVNYRLLKFLTYPIVELKHINVSLERDVKASDVIVDALFGVGLNRAIGGLFKSVIDMMNRSGQYIISVDIPSGLNGTTGDIFGTCVHADLTVTFTFAKKGFYKKAGPSHVGRVVVADIGIPDQLKKRI
ncbi:MAG: NAD(P)H-hydrate epimerase [Candidatus Omnitrophota bacterium]|nr:NAD(P)H-hydrate epimerase [Candidatus Omnitrophota bacterium]